MHFLPILISNTKGFTLAPHVLQKLCSENTLRKTGGPLYYNTHTQPKKDNSLFIKKKSQLRKYMFKNLP